MKAGSGGTVLVEEEAMIFDSFSAGARSADVEDRSHVPTTPEPVELGGDVEGEVVVEEEEEVISRRKPKDVCLSPVKASREDYPIESEVLPANSAQGT